MPALARLRDEALTEAGRVPIGSSGASVPSAALAARSSASEGVDGTQRMAHHESMGSRSDDETAIDLAQESRKRRVGRRPQPRAVIRTLNVEDECVPREAVTTRQHQSFVRSNLRDSKSSD